MSNLNEALKTMANSVYGRHVVEEIADSALPENWDEMTKEQRKECVHNALEHVRNNFGQPKSNEITIPIRRWKAIKYAAR